MLRIADFIAGINGSPLATWASGRPEQLVAESASIVQQLLSALPAGEYRVAQGVAVHVGATIEQGATLKPPLIVSAGAFVAANAYLRGGCWIGEGCCIGPSTELKSSFVFAGSTLAHMNFVGDSIIGSQVNFEAGAVACNHRNEHRQIAGSAPVVKFGALVGDRSRIGANAVLAPGTLLMPDSVVARLQLVDQHGP